MRQLIPFPIQVGTAIGIGLLTALAGALDVNLVTPGDYTIVTMGAITPKIMIAIAGAALVVTNTHPPACLHALFVCLPICPVWLPGQLVGQSVGLTSCLPCPRCCSLLVAPGTIIVGACLHHHVKAGFCIAMTFCTIVCRPSTTPGPPPWPPSRAWTSSANSRNLPTRAAFC
jgi:hypothetical protein